MSTNTREHNDYGKNGTSGPVDTVGKSEQSGAPSHGAEHAPEQALQAPEGNPANSLASESATSSDEPTATTPITIDEDARDTLDRYFYDNPLSPIRIYITTKSPKGPRLAMRPDAQTDKDLAFEAEDYTFLISPHLAQQLGHIRIAAYDMGFQVIPEHPLAQRSAHP